MQTRRSFLRNAGMLAGISAVDPIHYSAPRKLRIAACDWSIGHSSDPAAFALARTIGLEGVMVNMGSAGNNMHLRQGSIQQQYLDASKRTGVKISSLAIAELNSIPYKSDPRTEQWVYDSVDVAKALGVTVILLAFFDKNDLRNDAPGTAEVIRRLKKVMPHAEKQGITLGIESYLNAREHLYIMEKVGSDRLKVYYDFRNTADAGYDTVKEFKALGPSNICELHIKENGYLLGKGTLDWKRVFRAIKDTGYYGDGWMQIEGAVPDGADLISSYKHNRSFLDTLR